MSDGKEALAAVLRALAELKRTRTQATDASRAGRTAMLVDVMTSWATEECVWLVRESLKDMPHDEADVSARIEALMDEIGRAAADNLMREALFRPGISRSV